MHVYNNHAYTAIYYKWTVVVGREIGPDVAEKNPSGRPIIRRSDTNMLRGGGMRYLLRYCCQKEKKPKRQQSRYDGILLLLLLFRRGIDL